MTVRQLNNYLLVCEDTFFGVGCGAELLIEQAPSIEAAVDEARLQGWWVDHTGPFADPFIWFSICPACNRERERKRADWQAKQAAVAAVSGEAEPRK